MSTPKELEEWFEKDRFKEKDIIEKVDYLFEEIRKIINRLKEMKEDTHNHG